MHSFSPTPSHHSCPSNSSPWHPPADRSCQVTPVSDLPSLSPPKSLYSSLVSSPPYDILDPADQADLEAEAARCQPSAWPPKTAVAPLPPSLPPPSYHPPLKHTWLLPLLLKILFLLKNNNFLVILSTSSILKTCKKKLNNSLKNFHFLPSHKP